MLAKILLEAEDTKEYEGEDHQEGSVAMSLMTISELTDFVTSADELLKAKRVTVHEYARLAYAIFSGYSEVANSVFDAYCSTKITSGIKERPTLRCPGSEYQKVE